MEERYGDIGSGTQRNDNVEERDKGREQIERTVIRRCQIPCQYQQKDESYAAVHKREHRVEHTVAEVPAVGYLTYIGSNVHLYLLARTFLLMRHLLYTITGIIDAHVVKIMYIAIFI